MPMSTHLYRSRDDRMLAGVAGGLAELWDSDPSLVRLLWALLVILTGGIALVVYIVMAIVVPEEEDMTYIPAPTVPTQGDPATVPPTEPAAAPATSGAQAGPVAPPAPAPAAYIPAAVPYTATEARAARREARREARAIRRARRGDGPGMGAVVVGSLFVLLGGWFLVHEYLPSLDLDWFWPVTLVVVGALILVQAVSRRPDGTGSAPLPPAGQP